MNGLALCAGVGGLELGLDIALPGYRTVCYVEREAFAAATLAGRMGEGVLAPAPIWDDLFSFDGRRWRGAVDLLSAGFPCQPWSVAGSGKGTDDERWIWGDLETHNASSSGIVRIIGHVRPWLVFLENVPPLAVRGGLAKILTDLATLGFDAETLRLSASGVGASHGRDRLWIVAYRDDHRQQRLRQTHDLNRGDALRNDADRRGADVGAGGALADSRRERLPGLEQRRITGPEERGPRDSRTATAEFCSAQLGGAETRGQRVPLFPPGPSAAEEWRRILDEHPLLAPALESRLCGVVDGVPTRVDRLRACGNGVVPLAAAVAFRILAYRLGLDELFTGEA